MNKQIIVAMDNSIKNGIKLVAETSNMDEIYGYKLGSLWILENGISILKSFRDMLNSKKSTHKIILDMQKWGTDIPDIVIKQVKTVAPFVDELIVCPMGGGSDSLQAFIEECKTHNIKPICVVKMIPPNAGAYLKDDSPERIYRDSVSIGCNSFVIPATKDPALLDFIQNADLYATGFKTQGGQTKPMVDFGVSKFIVGRAIYESDNPTEVIKQIHIDINQEVIT